jgi:hypothetical protein
MPKDLFDPKSISLFFWKFNTCNPCKYHKSFL